MFCEKCGKEVKDDWNICPNCGNTLRGEGVNSINNPEMPLNSKKPFYKKCWFWLIMVIIGIIIIGLFSGNDTEVKVKETIEKLKEFTTMTEDEDSFVFQKENEWEIHYTTENEFVDIIEPEVLYCFEEGFGESDLGNNGEFKYDLDEDEARMYFDYYSEGDNKDLSVINYDVEKDKFTVLADGEHYEVSDELQKYLDKYGLANILKNDIEAFKEDVEEQGISFDGIKNLKYEDIAEYEK